VKIGARFLVRLYPRKWRERYGEEFEAFVGNRLNWRAAVDIGRAAIAQHTFGGSMEPTMLGGFAELGRDLKRDLIPWLPWRLATLWGIVLGAGFVSGETYHLRHLAERFHPHWLDGVGLATCFCAGLHGAWRRRDFGHGGLVALLTIFIGFAVAIAGNVTAVFVMSAFRTIDLREQLYWAIEVPLPIMLIVGGVSGEAGAALGAGLARLRRGRVTA
jgi:hypothetical protein